MADTYIQVILNSSHWDKASQRVKSSRIFENSHRKNEANQVGYLGEVIFEEFLKNKNIIFKDERDKTTHDYIINESLTLDLKTKDRTVRPLRHFDNSVPMYNHQHQRPRYYYFISLLRDQSKKSKQIDRFSHAFIMGGIGIKTLDQIGKRWYKDQVDPSNGTKFWTDCINVSMSQLISNKDMIEIFNKTKS